MFKERLLTAIILVPIVLLAIYFLPPIPFAVVTALVTLYAAWEWSFLMKIKTLSMRLLFLAGLIAVGIAVFFVPLRLVLAVAFLWWTLVFIFVLMYPKGTQLWYRYPIQRAIAGYLVLVPCWVSINFIRNTSNGFYKLLFLLFLIWGADISAYLVGKKWGHAKLAPHISPGKTWIGLIGALFFTIPYSFLAVLFFHMPLTLWQLGAELCFLTVIISVIGDLFESMMKRQAGVKDSSQLLPGHGGLLDRIDSLTAAAPNFLLMSMVLSRFARP